MRRHLERKPTYLAGYCGALEVMDGLEAVSAEVRLRRLIGTGRPTFVALDDGLYQGPDGLLGDSQALYKLLQSRDAPTAVLTTTGFARRKLRGVPDLLRIISVSYSDPITLGRKVRFGTVHRAIVDGADAIAVHMSIGVPDERKTVSRAKRVTDECHSLGFPALVASYARGKDPTWSEHLRAIEIAMQIGADIVKIQAPPQDADWTALGRFPSDLCIVLAGGPENGSAVTTTELLERISRLPKNIGMCFGRRVTRSQNPGRALQLMRKTQFNYPAIERIGTSTRRAAK